MEKNLGAVLVGDGSGYPGHEQLDAALRQLRVQCRRVAGHSVQSHPRILLREAVNDRRNDGGGNDFG
jgi:hypothetical protein